MCLGWGGRTEADLTIADIPLDLILPSSWVSLIDWDAKISCCWTSLSLLMAHITWDISLIWCNLSPQTHGYPASTDPC